MQRLLILGETPGCPVAVSAPTNSLAALLKLCVRLGHVLHVWAVHHANHAQHPPMVVQRGQRGGLQRHVLLHSNQCADTELLLMSVEQRHPLVAAAGPASWGGACPSAATADP